MIPNAKGIIPALGDHVSNAIVNNFLDLNYYRVITTRPDLMEDLFQEPAFESAGHTFVIAHESLAHLLHDHFDLKNKFLPSHYEWIENLEKLKREKVFGFFFGSKIDRTPLGLREIFEGQARFIQLQLLFYSTGKNLTFNDFESKGMFGEVYVSAFNWFLRLTGSQKPEKIDDPIVGLFLLICDMSINPGDGFPLPFTKIENIRRNCDPSFRFMKLCQVIAKNSLFKKSLSEYTRNEYIEVSEKLSLLAGFPSPLKVVETVSIWSKNESSIISLMKEDKTFQFKTENIVLRLLFARYINYSCDKFLCPEFFCWPGIYLSGESHLANAKNLHDRNQPLFVDKKDDDGIFPTLIIGREKESIYKTFNHFYAENIVHSMTAQWINEVGPFQYDFRWLTEKHSMEKMKIQADNLFSSLFNAHPDSFLLL